MVAVLATPRASTNGPAFAAGWVVGLGSVTAVLLALGAGASDSAEGGGTVVAVLQVGIGLAFLATAARKWATRPRPGEEPALPAWMATLDRISASRAFGFGLAASAANPKNIALTFTAAATMTDADLTGAGTVEAAVIFVALGSATVVGAVLLHLFGGDRAADLLERVRGFMAIHNLTIMLSVLTALGGLILLEGLRALLG